MSVSLSNLRPVVHQGDRSDDVRVGVAHGRSAVRRPARVGDACRSVERMCREFACKIFELALGSATLELSIGDRADAGGIVAAVFEPLQPVE